MSTDWSRMRVGKSAVLELDRFLRSRPDLRDVRGELLAALAEFEPAAHTYGCKKGLGLVEYKKVLPDELLVSPSGDLTDIQTLRARAAVIDEEIY